MGYIEYKGNGFRLEEVKTWFAKEMPDYKITQIDVRSDEVWLPEEYHHSQIVEWDMKTAGGQGFSKVHALYIPASIETVHVPNDIFPELEKVWVDPQNENFVTDGRMVFSKKGCELLYCFVCRGDTISIPDSVRRIASMSFCGTQYEEIRFPKTDMDISSSAFEGSRWLEQQGEMIIIGNMLYRAQCNGQPLTVPEGVKRLHPKLFSYANIPAKIISPFMLSQKDIYTIKDYGNCRSLEITSAQANINIRVLRKLNTLEKVVIVDGHKKYKSIDGVVYTRDGRTLVYYPISKKDHEFVIPAGVRKIRESAFAHQRYLEKIDFPDSVCTIGVHAFLECERLNSVHLSPNIRELPDANAYQVGGVFEGCPKLTHITLPEKMVYLGSFAFYRSGLSSITLNEKLEQIGEYALMAEALKDVSLPASVKRIGKGALFYARYVKAYEGTAKGLVAAVNATFPDMKSKSANVEWSRCEVTAVHRRNGGQELFLIPESLKRSAAYHLDMAWNADHIDYEEYSECLGDITDSGEKLQFAELGLLHFADNENNPYTDYIRQVSYKLAFRLLKNGKEKEFLVFLKRGFLTQNSLSKLLKFSNKQGMTVCSAYIMEIQSKATKKNSSFRL